MILAAATAKGVATRGAIVEHAIELVRRNGFESLSIGGLAQTAAMSKSGVFAHFGSREDLQLAVLDAVAEDFSQKVLQPAFRQPRGVRRLRTILSGWMDWAHDAGCPMIAAVIEYDDRPGAIRDRVVHWQRRLRGPSAARCRSQSKPVSCAPTPIPPRSRSKCSASSWCCITTRACSAAPMPSFAPPTRSIA
jgi:AcrR family transcriptional regulator